jgi:hypothetical protein
MQITRKHVLVACLWALTMSIVTACGSGGGGSSNSPTALISIDTPTTGSSTSATTIMLSGTAQMGDISAPLSIAPISWSVPGNSGVATRSIFAVFPFGEPAYSWNATVPLAFGDNTIIVTFLDATQSITVTRFTQVSVAGMVTMATTAAAVPGVMVSLVPSTGGSPRLVETDILGAYLFDGVLAGSYTVSPVAPAPPQAGSCFSFNPVNSATNISATDTTNKQADFIATTVSPCYGISGQIVSNANPSFGVPNISVTLMDSGGNALVRTTNGLGIFSFYELAPGTYTITPSDFFATFNPASTMVTITNASITIPAIAIL